MEVNEHHAGVVSLSFHHVNSGNLSQVIGLGNGDESRACFSFTQSLFAIHLKYLSPTGLKLMSSLQPSFIASAEHSSWDPVIAELKSEKSKL